MLLEPGIPFPVQENYPPCFTSISATILSAFAVSVTTSILIFGNNVNNSCQYLMAPPYPYNFETKYY
jgi:hypothetical protein